MNEHLERASVVIDTLARRYGRYLPDNALNTEADLKQEGWLVYFALMGKRYDPSIGKFETWLWGSVLKRFKTILKKERLPARLNTIPDSEAVDEICDNSQDPERHAMTADAIRLVAKHNVALAQAVTDGWPKGVLLEARRQNRMRQRARGGKAINGQVTVTKGIIQNFFNINLSKLRSEANNLL